MSTGGRPSKLTPEVQQRVIGALRLGLSRSAAAGVGRIAPRTLRDWLSRGERGEAPFDDLLEAVETAEGQAQAKLTGMLLKAASGDPKVTKWLLERRFPEDWGRRSANKGEDRAVWEAERAEEMRSAAKELERKLRLMPPPVFDGLVDAVTEEAESRSRAVIDKLQANVAHLSERQLEQLEALLDNPEGEEHDNAPH